MNKPDIRFNGFDEEWEEKNYKEVFDTSVSNNTLSRAELTSERTSTKNVHYGDILIKYNSILYANKDDFPFIPETVKVDSKNFLKNGDIVFADTAEDETCGKAVEITNLENENVLAGLHTFVARPKLQFQSKYLGYFIKSPAYHNQLFPYMQGTKVTSISKVNVQKTSVKYPNKAEQTKIGELFSKIDTLISSTQKEHEKLVAIKKCMLQKMFPKKGSQVPEIRFKGFTDEWVEMKLGDVADMYSGGTPSAGNSEFYNGNIPFIRSGEINSDETELFLTETGLKESSAKIVKKGTLLYALYGATSGEVGIAKLDGAINQAILAINLYPNYDIYFVHSWLRNNKKIIVDTFLQGGQGNLSGDIVKQFKICFPSYSEQQKIGSYFQNLDNLISSQAKKIEKLKTIKNTLLGKMFV